MPSTCPTTPTDLRNDENTRAELAKLKTEPIKYEQGDAMGRQINAHKYMECSAKTKEGVREVFEVGTRAALQSRNKKKKACAIL